MTKQVTRVSLVCPLRKKYIFQIASLPKKPQTNKIILAVKVLDYLIPYKTHV